MGLPAKRKKTQPWSIWLHLALDFRWVQKYGPKSYVPYSAFDVEPKCMQSKAWIKELATLFQYFWRGVDLWIMSSLKESNLHYDDATSGNWELIILSNDIFM